MNRGEIREKILYRLNQDTVTPKYWENDHINRLINEAYITLISKTHTLETSTTLSLIAYQHMYELVSSCFVLLRMFYETTDRLILPVSWTKLNSHDPYWVDTEDTRPRYFVYIPPNKVFLYPVVTSDSSDCITYHYTQLPDELDSDSESPDMPEIYHDALIYYPLSLALVRGGESAGLKKAEYYYNKFAEMVDSLASRTVKRSPRNMRIRTRF